MDESVDTFVLVIVFALILGVPLIGSLVAVRLVLEWFVY